MSFTNALWGGILNSFAFNPVDHECVLEISFDEAARCWRIEFMLWSEDAGLVLRCTQVSLDGSLCKPIEEALPGPDRSSWA